MYTSNRNYEHAFRHVRFKPSATSALLHRGITLQQVNNLTPYIAFQNAHFTFIEFVENNVLKSQGVLGLKPYSSLRISTLCLEITDKVVMYEDENTTKIEEASKLIDELFQQPLDASMLHTKKKPYLMTIDLNVNTPSNKYQQLIWIKAWNK